MGIAFLHFTILTQPSLRFEINYNGDQIMYLDFKKTPCGDMVWFGEERIGEGVQRRSRITESTQVLRVIWFVWIWFS